MSDFLNQVSKNIRRIRKEKNILQKDLSKHGMSYRYYQKIESGKANLTLKSLYDLAQVFNVPIDELTQIENNSNKTQLYKYFYSFFSNIPFGFVIWELKNLKDPESFVFFFINKYAKNYLSIFMEGIENESVLKIFPRIKEQNHHFIPYEVIHSGKPKKIIGFMQHDNHEPLSFFNYTIVKIAYNKVGILFDDPMKK
ncbi:MAG: helix-turn-helix transcriptional regulator [Deltaproteobacteria bacterium]|nr:helix-turn-helix transcriptional regulator [Deltaproteobacteria bacterium]